MITKIKYFFGAFFEWLSDPEEGFGFLKILIWIGLFILIAWFLASTSLTRGIFVVYLYCSCAVFFYKFIIKDKKFWCVGGDKRNWMDYLVQIGALIGLSIVFIKAISEILFFIPESLGEINEDGEWQSFKGGVCLGVGILFVFLFITLLYNYVRLWHEAKERNKHQN